MGDKMMEYNKREQLLEDLNKKNELKKLENFYINGKIENLPLLVEEKKKEIVEVISDYIGKYTETYYDEDGTEHTKIRMTPYIVSNYFFRSIINLNNIEPLYSAEQLSILWDLYQYQVEQVNIMLCPFTPTVSHFCKFIGITTNGFRKMKNSPDEGTRIIIAKIEDSCFDSNVTMAQMGKFKERSTVYRMKSEQERIEKETPQVIVHATNVDLAGINKRLQELDKFNKKVINGGLNEQ